jgi:hypothetical protein
MTSKYYYILNNFTKTLRTLALKENLLKIETLNSEYSPHPELITITSEIKREICCYESELMECSYPLLIKTFHFVRENLSYRSCDIFSKDVFLAHAFYLPMFTSPIFFCSSISVKISL